MDRSSSKLRGYVRALCMVLLGFVVTGACSHFVLQLLQQRNACQRRRECVDNLWSISRAKVFVAETLGLTNGESVPQIALQPYLGRVMSCPDGGTYIVGPVGTMPECTFTGASTEWSLSWKPLRLERHTWFHSCGKPALGVAERQK
jgi:hypothetical protein